MSATTITTISTDELAQRFTDDVGVHVWNVLTDEWFKGELIPGSRRVPGDRLGDAVRRSTLAKDASIVVYCAGPDVPGQPSGGGEARRPSATRASRPTKAASRNGSRPASASSAPAPRPERDAPCGTTPRSPRGSSRRYPIVQGPFGGGLSSPRLAATVSKAGGLGSFGAQGMTPDRIGAVVAEIRALTGAAVRGEPLGLDRGRARRGRDARRLRRGASRRWRRCSRELGIEPPPFPPSADPVLRGSGGGAPRGAAADLQLHLRRARAGDPRPLSIAGHPHHRHGDDRRRGARARRRRRRRDRRDRRRGRRSSAVVPAVGGGVADGDVRARAAGRRCGARADRRRRRHRRRSRRRRGPRARRARRPDRHGVPRLRRVERAIRRTAPRCAPPRTAPARC